MFGTFYYFCIFKNMVLLKIIVVGVYCSTEFIRYHVIFSIFYKQNHLPNKFGATVPQNF